MLFLLSAREPSGFPELPKIVTTRSQQGTMDAATAQQLATAIQVLAAAAAALPPPPAPPAPAAPAADPLMSPYKEGPLDLASQHRSSLFCDGNQSPCRMDYTHSFPGVHHREHPRIHPRDLVQLSQRPCSTKRKQSTQHC